MPKTDKHRDTERLREWCYEAQAKRGKKRQAVCVETCFAPLRAWVLSGWTGTQLALALDATTWGNRFGVLAISVLYPTPESAPPPRGTGPGCRYRDWWDRHSGRPACGPNGEGGGYRSRRRHAGVCPAEADRAGLTHVEFREGDAEHLDFPDQCFDVVLCVASLFFVPDMLAALREWWRVLVPGGYVGFCGFGPTFLQPLRDLWTARLQ